VTRTHLRDFFTSKDGTGLADIISRSYFSPNTLPASARIGGEAGGPALVRAKPTLPAKLNLMAASREDGATLRAMDGTCLAHYKVEHSVISFSLDDECMLDELAAIMPEVASYETGMLDFLFRGELALTANGSNVSVGGKGFGAGTIEILGEDDRGVRTPLGSFPTTGATGANDELAHVALPQTGTRVVAVFRGADSADEPIVAVGALPLSSH
jgi:hypothetical protein